MLAAMDQFRTIIEPFRIHAVEPIRITTRAEREAASRPPAATSSRSTPTTS